MTSRGAWRDDRINSLVGALSDLGMSMSQSAAGELIDERVKFVAAQARVSAATARGYLTDDAIKGLAEKLAFSFVEETPGADLFSAERDSRIPVRLAGRVSAGLAEAVRLRLVERDDLEHTRESVAQLAHSIGVLGLVVADQVAEDLEGRTMGPRTGRAAPTGWPVFWMQLAGSPTTGWSVTKPIRPRRLGSHVRSVTTRGFFETLAGEH